MYAGTKNLTMTRDPDGFKTMVAQLKKQQAVLENRPRKINQTMNDIVDIYLRAAVTHQRIDPFVKKIVEGVSTASVVLSHGAPIKMKDLWRAMEKITFEPNEDKVNQAQSVFDFARSGIQFSDYKSMGDVIEMLCTNEEIYIVRIKDRISSDAKSTSTGWSDVLVNFYFRDDGRKHICEVQLFHELMMEVRSNKVLGGHKGYELYRSIFELFEFCESPGSRVSSSKY